ncbi:MAG: amidohydrolase family protein [Balneola sp.]
MKKTAVLNTLVTFFFLILFGKTIVAQSNSPVTIIKNVNVFTGNEYVENVNVVFDEKSILSISSDIDDYKDATVIDGTNKTIIPPLVNAHVHVWSPAALKESLQAGIFANLDMHTTDESANLLRAYNDSLGYSKYFSSNAAATVPNGHGTQFGIPVPTINDEVSPEQFVQDRLDANADYIKVIREPIMSTLSKQQSLKVIQAAHKSNVLAVGHSHILDESITLAEQGIDGLVHIWIDKKADKETLSAMKDGKMFMAPTILVTDALLKLRKNAGRSESDLSTEEVLQEIKKAHDAGIPILAATDSPNMQFNFSDQLFDEMDLIKKAGLSNIEVLKSTTTNTYTAFSLDGFTELKKGSLPNFVLVEGNPVTELNDIRNKKMVYQNGKLVFGGS